MLRGGGGDFAGGSDSDAGSAEELDRALGAEEAPTPAAKKPPVAPSAQFMACIVLLVSEAQEWHAECCSLATVI